MRYKDQDKKFADIRQVKKEKKYLRQKASTKKKFPINVEIEGCFYVVESSLNFK
jgi:hypothetical protein